MGASRIKLDPVLERELVIISTKAETFANPLESAVAAMVAICYAFTSFPFFCAENASEIFGLLSTRTDCCVENRWFI